MADKQQQENKQDFQIHRIYTKDLSYESPHAPMMFKEQGEPSVDLELNTNTQQLTDDIHEVVLRLTVTSNVNDKVAYLIEVQQAGIFTLQNFDAQHLHHMLGSFCPSVIYPYARELISELVVRGGFPQLCLAPVNFEALYQQHLKSQAEEGGDAEGGSAGDAEAIQDEAKQG